MVIVFGAITILLLLSLGASIVMRNSRGGKDADWFWKKSNLCESKLERSFSRKELEILRQLFREKIGVDVAAVDAGFKLQVSPLILQEIARNFFSKCHAGVAPEIDFWDQDVGYVVDAILNAYLNS